MTTEDRRYTLLLQRHGIRERVPALWKSVPSLEGDLLEEWCRQSLRANFNSLYDTYIYHDTYIIREAGVALARNLGVDLPYNCGISYGEDYEILTPRPVHIIIETAEGDRDQLLNILDYMLAARLVSESEIEDLRAHLRDGHSAWQVKDDVSGLTLRVPPEEEEAYQDAIGPGDQASEYLINAWDAARRHNQPSAKEAYGDAVNAIEAVLAPIVIPDDPLPSLGKIIPALRDKPEKWDTRFRGTETVEALEGLLEELWRTNGSRHAGMPANTLEQAQDAVTIAVAVVALTRRGFLKRVDDS